MKSLHSRLRSILLLLALPAVTLIVLQALMDRNKIIIDGKKSAERIAGALAMEQKQIIAETEEFLRRLAELPQVHVPDAPQCTEFLSATLNLTANYANLGVPLANGQLVCNALPMAEPVNVADRVYFQQARDERRFSVSTVQQDRATTMPSVNFAYPVQPEGPDGPVVGVAVAVVSLAWWSQRLGMQNTPEGAVVFVADSAQRLAAYFPDEPGILGQHVSVLGFDMRDEVGAGYDIRDGKDGVRRLFHRARLFQDTTGKAVFVGVGIPIDRALIAANLQALRSLAILFFGALTMWLLVRYWTRRVILQPLQDLKQQVQNGGRLQDRRAGVANIEEFSYLSAEFEKAHGGLQAAERAERNRREQLEAVLDALPDLYFRINQNQEIVEYRAQNVVDLLLHPDEFLGRRVSDVLPPEARQKFEENINKQIDGGAFNCWEYSLNINEETQHFEVRACPVRGDKDTILVIRNITKRRRAENAMRLSAMVYERSSEGMVVVDAELTILTVNPAFTRLTGKDAGSLEGVNLRQIVPQSIRRRLRNGIARARTAAAGGNGWGGELQLLGPKDTPTPAWFTINAILDEKGQLDQFAILVRDMTDQKKANDIIWKQAHIDALTGLLNRVALAEHLEEMIADSGAGRKELALLFLDLDGLKQVNDRQGHAAGDLVLHEVAHRLRHCLGDEVAIARYGGDEFIIILDDTHIPGMNDLVETLLEEIATPFELEGELLHLTASLGIARFPEDAVTAEDLISAADQAMYVAKSSGRNRATPFSPGIRRAAIDKMHMVSELQKAIYDTSLQVYFQPIIDLKTGRIRKAEALLRWRHETLGQVAPDQFIPLAEEVGLIERLGDVVFQQAHDALPELRRRFGDDFQVSINVSPSQLSSSMEALRNWVRKIEQSGQSGQGFIIEITENALLDQQNPVVGQLDALQRAGFQIALDDFGKGYSSLFYFLKHKIDYLKIDQEFVRNLPGNGKAETLCRSMIEMAHRLNVQVVAEGIETENQSAFLAQIGADFGQGFLFEHPLPLSELLQVSTDRLDEQPAE